MSRSWFACAAFSLALVSSAAQPAAAEIPDAKTLLTDIGFTPDQIGQVQAGSFVSANMKASTERELVAGFAFLVHAAPADLLKQLRPGLLAPGGPDDAGDRGGQRDADAREFREAHARARRRQARSGVCERQARRRPSTLSSAEIAPSTSSEAAPQRLPSSRRCAARCLRLTAYQTKGLAGIAPLCGSRRRSARRPTSCARRRRPPSGSRPRCRPPTSICSTTRPGSRRQRRILPLVTVPGQQGPDVAAHARLFVPGGDACDGAAPVLRERRLQLEQAIGALLPMQTGTLVIYTIGRRPIR